MKKIRYQYIKYSPKLYLEFRNNGFYFELQMSLYTELYVQKILNFFSMFNKIN